MWMCYLLIVIIIIIIIIIISTIESSNSVISRLSFDVKIMLKTIQC